jgi:hypothetical protein
MMRRNKAEPDRFPTPWCWIPVRLPDEKRFLVDSCMEFWGLSTAWAVPPSTVNPSPSTFVRGRVWKAKIVVQLGLVSQG